MKIIHLVVILFMICGSSYSQQYQEEPTHYVFPEFTSGIVLKKNGTTHNVPLNYNAFTEEMVFEDRGQKLAMLEREVFLIDTVWIRDRKFIVLNNKFVEYLDLLNGELYVEYKCRVKEAGKPSAFGGTSEISSAVSLSTFISNGTIYEINLPGNFTAEPYFHYWLNKNGEISRFVNLRQLRNLYKGKEDLFKEYVKENDVKYTDKQNVIRLVEYLESNQSP